jgi:hypothetical protein
MTRHSRIAWKMGGQGGGGRTPPQARRPRHGALRPFPAPRRHNPQRPPSGANSAVGPPLNDVERRKSAEQAQEPPGTPGTTATWGVGGSKGRVALLRRRPRTATHPWSLSLRTVASGATNGAPPSLSRGGPRSARIPLPPQQRGPPRLGHDNTRSLSKARQLTAGPTLTHDPHGSGAAHAPARPQVPSCVSRARRSLRRSLGGSAARHIGRETRGARERGVAFHYPDGLVLFSFTLAINTPLSSEALHEVAAQLTAASNLHMLLPPPTPIEPNFPSPTAALQDLSTNPAQPPPSNSTRIPPLSMIGSAQTCLHALLWPCSSTTYAQHTSRRSTSSTSAAAHSSAALLVQARRRQAPI